ncbi:MAG: AAA family ATPase, partial [Desulfobacteraceae bacterium]|nr:AAA family ATPase [Desulfobacteraceae bacterium]
MAKRSTKQKPLDQAVTQLAWIAEPQPDIPIEHIIKLVLACHKDKKNVWCVYDVKRVSIKYYSYLFVLSVLAQRYLRNTTRQEPSSFDKHLVQFPIYIDDDIYGQIVKYLHNIKSKSRNYYRALNWVLRHNVRNIFDYSSEDGRKNIVLVGGRSPDDFKFAEACKYPDDLFQGPFPKEIDISKIDLESAPITTKSLNGLVDRICGSDLWGKWAEETKGWHRRRRKWPEHEDLWYLRRTEDVLQMYDDAMEQQKAQWFRRTGPLAIDFKKRTFYPRKDRFSQLKSLVTSKSVSLLEGVAASGKTVLVLNLAYELCRIDKAPVYYFDCDKERDFDKSRLLSDIKSVKGVIIIENVHLAPQKFQQIYSDFKYDKKRKILFTGRSFSPHQDSKSEDLSKIPTLHIEPFEEV